LCKKKFSWKRDTVQGEKARRIPQLLQARAEEAEVAPNAKNSNEFIRVYGPCSGGDSRIQKVNTYLMNSNRNTNFLKKRFF
jgi:hypothetical protein